MCCEPCHKKTCSVICEQQWCRLNGTISALVGYFLDNMCGVARIPTFRICENKDADQLRGNCTADQHLCFRYI